MDKSDLTLGRFVVEFRIIVALPGSENKIIPNADKINQSSTFINTINESGKSQCLKPWLWIPFTKINYLLLNSALAFFVHRNIMRSAPFDR